MAVAKKPADQLYKTLNFTVHPQMYKALNDYCISMGGRPKSRVIQDALAEYLERHKDDKPVWVKAE